MVSFLSTAELVILSISLLCLIGFWIVYKKAGRPGWASLIPIYCFIVLLQIAKKPIWWIVFFLIPAVNIVFFFLTYNSLAKKFGKGSLFAAGLLLLPFIFFPILGFDSSTYDELA